MVPTGKLFFFSPLLLVFYFSEPTSRIARRTLLPEPHPCGVVSMSRDSRRGNLYQVPHTTLELRAAGTTGRLRVVNQGTLPASTFCFYFTYSTNRSRFSSVYLSSEYLYRYIVPTVPVPVQCCRYITEIITNGNKKISLKKIPGYLKEIKITPRSRSPQLI